MFRQQWRASPAPAPAWWSDTGDCAACQNRPKTGRPDRPRTEAMTPQDASRRTAEICALAPVDPGSGDRRRGARARRWPRALVAGGLPALEVTLRTPGALDAIRAMAEVEGGVVGAGTLLTPADVKAAKAAGATLRGLARRHRPAAGGLRGRGPAASGRCGHRDRGDAALRARLHGGEVLPRRGRRRRRRAEGDRRADPAGAVLPHRRRQPEERARLPRAAERDVRGRLLGRAERRWSRPATGPGSRHSPARRRR